VAAPGQAVGKMQGLQLISEISRGPPPFAGGYVAMGCQSYRIIASHLVSRQSGQASDYLSYCASRAA